MTGKRMRQTLLGLLAAAAVALVVAPWFRSPATPLDAQGRPTVVFWHFWGGADRAVVESIVARFNASQDRYAVRSIAMPGNNLDLKVFLAVTGGDPPDVINQDDPIVGDWAARGALQPLDEVATRAEIEALDAWLVPAARRLGSYEGRLFALCNGLDIRALYYNATLLDEYGLAAPRTLDELDHLARVTTNLSARGTRRLGFVPDPRRLWAWGIVHGGGFFDASGRVACNEPRVVAALEWMARYRDAYGADTIAAFRQGDQSLPGKTFPLLAGRYAAVMDGQWRVRDIAAAQEAERRAGRPVTRYGVCALPPPDGGLENAGWVNGNFFVIPRGARCAAGAWEFMKFWSGFGHEDEAARTCAEGGWIPVSDEVSGHAIFERFVAERPLFATFVALSRSPHQHPTPVVPGAPFVYREVNEAAARCLYREAAASPRQLLDDANRRIRQHLDRLE